LSLTQHIQSLSQIGRVATIDSVLTILTPIRSNDIRSKHGGMVGWG